jgi:hypothetical protein
MIETYLLEIQQCSKSKEDGKIIRSCWNVINIVFICIICFIYIYVYEHGVIVDEHKPVKIG